jgi:tRNA (guanine-N7-)-methyltransferase
VRVEGRTVLAQIIPAWHTIYEIIQLGEINMRLRNVPGAREVMVENEYVFTEPEGMKGTWHEVFGNDNPVRIEIGMGKGRFISTLAAQNPDINYVGIEKYSSVLLRAVEKQEELQLPNLRFIRMDAENICEVFGAGEVDRIYLNFSDPWPKDRHAKRRLTSRQFFARYNVILKQDGQVEFKTDNKDLFDFSVEEVKEAEWKLTSCTYDLHHDAALNEGNVMTEYEERFSKAGNPICKLIAKR